MNHDQVEGDTHEIFEDRLDGCRCDHAARGRHRFCAAPGESRQQRVDTANQRRRRNTRHHIPGRPGGSGSGHLPKYQRRYRQRAHIRGWYCPATGRIHFVHRNLDSGDAVRIFTGNVSDLVAGQPTFMAGTMTVLISAFGNLGEYNFSGVSD